MPIWLLRRAVQTQRFFFTIRRSSFCTFPVRQIVFCAREWRCGLNPSQDLCRNDFLLRKSISRITIAVDTLSGSALDVNVNRNHLHLHKLWQRCNKSNKSHFCNSFLSKILSTNNNEFQSIDSNRSSSFLVVLILKKHYHCASSKNSCCACGGGSSSFSYASDLWNDLCHRRRHRPRLFVYRRNVYPFVR